MFASTFQATVITWTVRGLLLQWSAGMRRRPHDLSRLPYHEPLVTAACVGNIPSSTSRALATASASFEMLSFTNSWWCGSTSAPADSPENTYCSKAPMSFIRAQYAAGALSEQQCPSQRTRRPARCGQPYLDAVRRGGVFNAPSRTFLTALCPGNFSTPSSGNASSSPGFRLALMRSRCKRCVNLKKHDSWFV